MIRKLNINDLTETTELIYKTTIDYKTSKEITSDKKSKELFVSMFEEAFNDMELFGYFNENKMLGVIGIEDNNYIPILYVLKEYQNLGVGSMLLEYVINYLKNKTDLIDVCAFYKAVPFYEKHGFILNENPNTDKVMMSYKMNEKTMKGK